MVKSLNTMNVSMMLGQESYPAHHNIFMTGNDADAKQQVASLLADSRLDAREHYRSGGDRGGSWA